MLVFAANCYWFFPKSNWLTTAGGGIISTNLTVNGERVSARLYKAYVCTIDMYMETVVASNWDEGEATSEN